MLKPFNIPNIIPAGTVMNATINSIPLQVYNGIIFSLQIFFSGTPAGSFKLQASDDPAAAAVANAVYTSLTLPKNWSDISGSGASVSAAGDVGWNYRDPGFNWVRVVYTDSSGGTSTAAITSSVFNEKGV